MTKQRILFDTDPGVDDALALLYLHRHPNIELLGITTVFGNASISVTTRNARFLAEAWGIKAPVHAGASVPLNWSGAPHPYPVHVHGANGLGDYPIAQEAREEKDTAARFIVDTVRQNPRQVRLLAVGGLTNLARALEADPAIADLVQDVVVMGGAFEVPGNVSPVAEANIYADPKAADRVFAASWKVTAVPLNLTNRTVMTRQDLAAASEGADAAMQMVAALSQGYIDFYLQWGEAGMLVHDCSAAVYLTDPHLFATRSGSIVVLEDGPAAGMTVQRLGAASYSPNKWDQRPMQSVCVGGDAAGILARIYAVCRGSFAEPSPKS
ncbi:nucleoside hydrolase [Mesorhizobium sp. M1A.F.Ca.IN.022.07.1.1]|uniref:nucleoside hydrolase n=1 Tax=unclassified Mesorhizobium TaxID=325217 RepID=UPI000BB05313|nr:MULTISPECIES: nucleoside hydrolase [unclassified Mesorhizobium]MDG4852519.1 nucleoside hydrolase [Mesorhizobium sp. WSM4982]MDG4902129.1 nucleoside hydrolase [Mesorhizobium sp. WSM4962]MDG4906951.1 nucleoside hydrolase [Mesorhizobium sp. WSM4898]MDG4911968.1 nucleoside hydrolase [Mesorhizobium sp. WSM4983]MDG4919617.1 nucleoside hydrolase [Mesorhizobium sp. WSM4989]